MSLYLSQASFDYDANPIRNAWTQKYVGDAFPKTHKSTVTDFYHRAQALARVNNVLFDAFKALLNPRMIIEVKRAQAGTILQDEFRNSMEIQRHPDFLVRCAKDAVTYADEAENQLEIREKS